MIKNDDPTGPSELLDQVNALRVVFPLDFFVILKGGMFRWSICIELEACCIKTNAVLLSSKIFDDHFLWYPRVVGRTFSKFSYGIYLDPSTFTVWRRYEERN